MRSEYDRHGMSDEEKWDLYGPQNDVPLCTRDEAKNVQFKLQMLAYADIFSTGVVKSGGGYILQIVLRKPAPYGMPESIDGVPIVCKTLEEAKEEYDKSRLHPGGGPTG